MNMKLRGVPVQGDWAVLGRVRDIDRHVTVTGKQVKFYSMRKVDEYKMKDTHTCTK